jgi:hypothetical protein
MASDHAVHLGVRLRRGAARHDPILHLSSNHGHPQVAATAHSGQFKGAGIVAARPGKPVFAPPPKHGQAVAMRAPQGKPGAPPPQPVKGTQGYGQSSDEAAGGVEATAASSTRGQTTTGSGRAARVTAAPASASTAASAATACGKAGAPAPPGSAAAAEPGAAAPARHPGRTRRHSSTGSMSVRSVRAWDGKLSDI